MNARAQAHTASKPTVPTPVTSGLAIQRRCGCGATTDTIGACAECTKNKERTILQRSARNSSNVLSVPPSVHQAMSTPGQPMDRSTRDFMEPRFGHDFSHVRLHTDRLAGESAEGINAHAYTSGNDIAFANGKYQPGSHSGRHLLAHELAHTIQQQGLQRRVSDYTLDTASDSHLEREAERAANAVVNGQRPVLLAGRTNTAIISRARNDIVTTAVQGKAAKTVHGWSGHSHKVTPTGVGTKEIDDAGSLATLEEFSVEPFYLPAEKGPGAFSIYNSMATGGSSTATGGSLESTLELSGARRTKTALWQERPDTEDLRTIWLQKVGWAGQTTEVINDLWQRCGGDAVFPKVHGATAEMDHIVELQIGGNNTKENIQPLEKKPNQSSGGAIKQQLQTLATAIAGDAALSGGNTQQVKMRFTAVKQVGTPAALSTSCPPKGNARTALNIEACALKLPLTKSASGAVSVARTDYPIAVGGRPQTTLKVPATFATRPDEIVPIKGDAENNAASTLIPGLQLNSLSHRPKKTVKPDRIEAQVDTSEKTRLPITLEKNSKPIILNVAADGTLSLPASFKKTSLGFTYKYLSPGTIHSIGMNAAGGIDWSGQIKPTASFLPSLDVEYKEGNLRLVTQISEEKLKRKKLFGASITKAALELELSPEFDVNGYLDFIVGNANKPMAVGSLTLGKDDQGLVGTAKVKLQLPKIDTTEITFNYKGGEDREEWSGELKIESTQIKLPYVSGGSIVARVVSKAGVADLTFDGKLDLTLPHNRGSAEVSLKRWGNSWVLAGGANLDIPKVDNFSAWITYDIANETLTASVPGEDGKSPKKPIGFTIGPDFKGTLERLNLKIAKGGAVTVTGAGGFSFRKGKAKGSVHVDLAEDGSFNGKGDMTYAFSEKLSVDGSIEFKEKGTPKLRVVGSLTLARLELLRAISDQRTIFDKEFSIPIPYASIGGVGLKAIFAVNLQAGYTLGPIVVEPLVFTAGFNPMDEEPQLNLGVSGELKAPLTATLSASVSGGVKIDALIAEVGGKITITGTMKLNGGLFVPFTGKYSNSEFSVELTPEARLKLLLGVALTATVWAEVGVGFLSTGTEKTWVLGKREVDTGLDFGIKVPVSYNSRTGAKMPTADRIELIPPDFSKENLTRVAERLFGEANGDPSDA